MWILGLNRLTSYLAIKLFGWYVGHDRNASTEKESTFASSFYTDRQLVNLHSLEIAYS